MPTAVEQTSLQIVESRPVGEQGDIPLALIEPPTIPITLSDEFVQSVRILGVLQPVVLIDQQGGLYRIAAGRRRVQAAILCDMDRIPAVVYPPDTPIRVAAAMGLVENAHRRSNPRSDFDNIFRLVQEGFSREEIAATLGMSLSTVNSRMRLGNLTSELFQRLGTELSASLAQRIVGWSIDAQRELERSTRGRRITAADVREVQRSHGPMANLSEETEEMFPSEALEAVPQEVYFASGEIQLDDGTRLHPLIYRGERWVPETCLGRLVVQSEIPMEPSWSNVVTLLENIDRILPIAPNDDTDQFYVLMSEMRTLAERQAGGS